jgi:alpha-methylacyl-CoA racemase
LWTDGREANFLDGGAPFYGVYQTADGKYVSLACLEPKFYEQFLRLAGLENKDLPAQMDKANWPRLKERLKAVFKGKTREEWCALLEGTDACFAPVLSLKEAPGHPHHQARGTFLEIEGVIQPAPAPRFSRTPPQVPSGPCRPGQHTKQALLDWGVAAREVARLRREKVVA